MKLPMIMLVFLTLGAQAQNQLVNNGAVIKVQSGANLRVDNGGILNKNAGTIDNSGNVYLDANYNQITSAVYNGSTGSWLWFEGAANQNITGDAALNINRLRVDNGNRLVFGNHVNVANQTDLNNNGDIELGNFNLVMAPGSTVTGYNANNYIITNGTGYLQREVGATAVDFPIGIANYNLATLTNSGTVDNFQARLEDFAREGYPSNPVEVAGVVGRAWFIEEQTIGGSVVTMTLQWDTPNELPGFNRSLSGISHWEGTYWDRSPSWTAAPSVGPSSWNQTRTGITSFSPFVVEDVDMDLPIELMAFNAVRKNNTTVSLDWTTASETNNMGFYVERMLKEETEFKTVAWVDGFGTTSETTHYALEDDNSSTEVSYYRLRQVDFDGTETLSDIRAVNGSKFSEFSNVVLFPVPVSDVLNIRFGKLPKGVESAEVLVMDALGRVLLNASVGVQSNQILQIEELKEWPSGNYFLTIQLDNGATMNEKFIKR